MDSAQLLPITGRLLSAVVVLIVSLSSFSLGWSILKLGALSRSQRLFAYFWISTGFLWFSSTVRNVAAAYERTPIDELFFYGSQLFLYVSGVFLAPYLAGKAFPDKKYISNIVQYIYLILGAMGFMATLMYGIKELPSDFFTTKYFVVFPASLFSMVVMAPVIIVSIIETVYQASRFIGGAGAGFEVLSVLSILLYVSVGVIDQGGFVAGWGLIILRLAYIAIFLLARGAISRERETHAIEHKEERVFYVS